MILKNYYSQFFANYHFLSHPEASQGKAEMAHAKLIMGAKKGIFSYPLIE